ncbi:MAG: DUF4388 domain-containing protein [Deltaproteobacteria bacterium]|nr:DUF4388 domain-containing protein [Deltaproteobacteria bacterium]
MKLNGYFEPSSLASILQLLSNEDRTGMLRLTNKDSEVNIFVREGTVICVTGSAKETRLGNILRRKNMVSAADLAYCLSVSREKNVALGKVLVEKGFISEETLRNTVHDQAQEVLFNLFFWKGGKFEYHDSTDVPKGALDTKIDIMNVIMEAMSRIDEMCTFMKQIPSEEIIFAKTEPLKDPDELGLTDSQKRFYALIDGARTVRQVITASGFEDFSAYHLFNRLITAGAVVQKDTAVFSEEPVRDYTDIVQVYADIIQVIRTNLARELDRWLDSVIDEKGEDKEYAEIAKKIKKRAKGRWIYNVMENCKPRMVRHQEVLLAAFRPTARMEENVKAVAGAMRNVKNSEKSRLFLAKTMNQYVSNLLHTTVNSFGLATTRKMLLGINHVLIRANESGSEFSEKNIIVKDMVDLLIDVASQTKNPEYARQKTYGIFSMLESPLAPPASDSAENAN